MPSRRPKKRFSQNFLADKNIAREIVDLLEPSEDDVIFEIGSGRGTLTEIIAESGARLFSFEIDIDLIDVLNKKFAGNDRVEIINSDFLLIDPRQYHKKRFKLIGNIPYDITSPLIDWIIRHYKQINRVVITTQKEMADRICSREGSKNWAPIAIFAACYFDIVKSKTIPPAAFYPPPKVTSATMLFEPRQEYQINNPGLFAELVKQSFVQRRKQLLNNLDNFRNLNKEEFGNILKLRGLGLNIRAEQLSINDFIFISDQITLLEKS